MWKILHNCVKISDQFQPSKSQKIIIRKQCFMMNVVFMIFLIHNGYFTFFFDVRGPLG